MFMGEIFRVSDGDSGGSLFNGFGIDLCLFFGVKNFYGLEIFLIFSSTEEEWDFRASN